MQATQQPGPATLTTMLHLHAMYQDLVAAGQAHTATAHAASSAQSAGILNAGQTWLQLEAAVCISVLPELAAAGMMMSADEAQVCTHTSHNVATCFCQLDACLETRECAVVHDAAVWRTALFVCSSCCRPLFQPGWARLSSV